MAQQTTTRENVVLTVPGTYVSQRVIAGQGGTGLSGVLCLVGEADEGRHWSEATDVSEFGYRPDQLNAAIAEFGSGNLIDAFKAAISGNGDPKIAGSVNLVYLIKTNASTKASASISRAGFGAYGSLRAKRAGKPGNSISALSSTAQAEAAPIVSNIDICQHPSLTTTLKIRINGGAELSAAIAALPASVPTKLTTSLEALASSGVLVQGGVARNILPGGAPTLSIAASGANALISLSSGSWATTPSANDVLMIYDGSSLSGAGNANEGTYRVLSATASAITAAPINTVGALAPVSGAAQGTGATAAAECFSPASIQNATGMDRQVLSGLTGNITSSNLTSSTAKLSLDSGVIWAAAPQVNELVWVPTLFAGIDAGWYKITAVSNIGTGTINIQRLSNGAISGPAGSAAVASQIQVLKSDIDGVGKSMEIIADADSATILKAAASGSALAELDSLVVSAAERKAQTLLSKPASLNPITETYIAGGDLVMAMGYAGATASVTITDTALTTSCAVAADNLSLNLADYKTMKDLVDYINTRPSYSASVMDSRWNAVSPTKLDNLTANMASSLSAKPARLKKDADDWYQKLSQSAMVEVPTYSTAGLPDADLAAKFLSSGAKGGTSSAQYVAAVDACELLDLNFMVPCFDRDATADIADSLTESSSDYTIDAINAYAKSHCIAMSEIKARKNRMCVVAKQAAYADCKTAARDLSHPRVAMAFQKCKDTASDGTQKSMPCWYTAAKTAGMSAVAGYKGIVKKFVNISGILPVSGFDARRRGDLEDALTSGLLIVEPVVTGGFRYVSDQTTYNIDNNFVYNSIQAVYLADLVTLTLIQNADRVIVGESVAQMSASIARGFIQTEMANFLRLNWIARSDDAPLGYKNLAIQLNGGVMNIDVEIKLAGLVYFVPISLALSEVSQSA